ncbi:hypothetical protein Dfri01_41760 [Dyadobacter frigoris]|nr:hypothetical protein Dfri01_41760 [Dyadobacter frigoris]
MFMIIITYQQTINSPIMISGVGLHSGKKTFFCFIAAPLNYGIKFRKTDSAGQPVIANLAASIKQLY